MARPDQNPNHQADKENTDDVSDPDNISYPRQELPIIAPKLGCPKQSKKQKQIRKNCTRFEKNRVFFHRNPPTIYKTTTSLIPPFAGLYCYKIKRTVCSF